MSLLPDSTVMAAADRRQRWLAEAAAHRHAHHAISLSRLSRSRRSESVTSARWQPVIAANVDLRCLRAD